MSPVGLLPWLRAHLMHSDVSDNGHEERMDRVDAELEVMRRRRIEYRRRISVAERKYRGYGKPVQK